jgi:hypothetical protein
MDDYKRALHMSAQRLLSERRVKVVCSSLERAISDEGALFEIHDVIEELFPEFFSLHDVRIWFRDGTHLAPPHETASNFVWWDCRWFEPRIRVLDCVLNNDVRPINLIKEI